MAVLPRLAVLMPLWPLSTTGLEGVTFSLYTFEGQKIAPREIASIIAAAPWLIMLLSGSDKLIYKAHTIDAWAFLIQKRNPKFWCQLQ